MAPGTPPADKHLVIIDGHHLMYRAYWAIPRNMVTKKGEQVNAVFGVASMLLNILKTEQPDSIVVCFDAGEETFRHSEYADYKAGRAETPDDFYVQIPRIRELIDAFGFASVEDRGFEADDFACAYAKVSAGDGARVTIISGDRDLLQIVTDRVRVAVPHKGYQMPEYLGPKEVEAKFGVTPAQVASYKGLVGDSSDNLKGVMGIGPKAASALLSQYRDLDGIYKNLADIKPGWRAKLEAGKEHAYFCERMATLICDMPLPVALSRIAIPTIDADRLLTLFSDLEFVLLTRRFKTLVSENPYFRAHFSGAKLTANAAVTAVPASAAREQLSLL